MKNRVHL